MKPKLLLQVIDNISVRNKLILIYIVCVFIPIILVNLVFYNNTSKLVRQREIGNVDLSMDRISSGILKEINDCVGVVFTLNSDFTLSGALEKQYTEHNDYLDAYESYLAGSLAKFEPAYKQIQKISIYTDNKTILNGGSYFYSNEDVKLQEWYKRADDRILVYPYISNSRDFIENKKRYFSIIKRLNNSYGNYINKIVKIDVKLGSFGDIMSGEKLSGDIFLLDDKNHIVYSTNSLYNDKQKSEFDLFSSVKVPKNMYMSSKEFGNVRYLNGWKVVGVFPEENVFIEMKSSRNYILTITLVSLIIVTAFIYLISNSISTRLKIISRHIQKVSKQNFEPIATREGKDEIGVVIVEFNKMTAKIKQLIQDIYQADIQKKSLELERKQAVLNALESQINPHFLYNILNTVSIKSALKNEFETAEIIKYIAKAFRRVITWGNDLITIKDEIGFAEEFLKIQKYRFEDHLEYSIHADEDLLECKIPKMTIQPFIENASVHGIEKSRNTGSINLEVRVSDGRLLCKIEDNGVGIAEDRLELLMKSLGEKSESSNRVGIKNVYSRLSLYYGDKFEFKIDSRENLGTIITISLPLETVNKL